MSGAAPRGSGTRVHDWHEKRAKGKEAEKTVGAWLETRCGEFADVSDVGAYQKLDVDFVADGDYIEVKSDFRAHETGLFFLELEALAKSRAHRWLLFVPQRGWVLDFRLDELRDYTLSYLVAHPDEERTVRTRRDGREWEVHGVPIRLSELLLRLRGTLSTRITEDEGDEA